ncbi:lantibiotic immunity ABC transporter MutG family permease subunit [Clostridium estertheticum]|uniref:Lantibiotic immunity ABC transporter MutG family permease subunit n=1 Tax=Clostridium estertheticum TaxID=238834 RepID=A0AA47I4B7_9CLOT|nr:lantibiotic immunity ABC transporter MutG family permease subunit [Clostridium estertheticum]MBU3155710.1 lantibiotic immunity ABC transporter MutG family permease subunit [Clostridium estertheticum]MBU3201205.1 lantibiotic immunity ABC transporter MutG family permease subunit [Clostridium estertheticum]WAG59062.1 lantibiotic immunity ABC transporter MutG family permease subunit [Clostridium estertheticum]WAG66887.1 lantibiotic immunity ABC transporter MutG family permease subunit [Clostridi
MNIFKCISADWMKTKRTAIRLIFISIPITYSILMLLYFSNNKTQYIMYDGFFKVISVFLPLLVGLISGLIGMQEEGAGNFSIILSSTVPRTTSYLSKLFLLEFMTTISIFLSTSMFLLGMRFILHIENIQYSLFFQGSLLTVIGCLFLYVFYLFLSFAFGMGVSIALGGAGFLIAAIMGATVVGDKIWKFIPWTWSTRLSIIPESLMPGIQLPIGLAPSQVLMWLYGRHLPFVFVITIMLIIASIIWFNRWEGRKSYE